MRVPLNAIKNAARGILWIRMLSWNRDGKNGPEDPNNSEASHTVAMADGARGTIQSSVLLPPAKAKILSANK